MASGWHRWSAFRISVLGRFGRGSCYSGEGGGGTPGHIQRILEMDVIGALGWVWARWVGWLTEMVPHIVYLLVSPRLIVVYQNNIIIKEYNNEMIKYDPITLI